MKVNLEYASEFLHYISPLWTVERTLKEWSQRFRLIPMRPEITERRDATTTECRPNFNFRKTASSLRSEQDFSKKFQTGFRRGRRTKTTGKMDPQELAGAPRLSQRQSKTQRNVVCSGLIGERTGGSDEWMNEYTQFPQLIIRLRVISPPSNRIPGMLTQI